MNSNELSLERIQAQRSYAVKLSEDLSKSSCNLEAKSDTLKKAISSLDEGVRAYLATGNADWAFSSLNKALEQLAAILADSEAVA